jgi:manganese-dependent inorganic pyrophosphatase
VAPVIFGQIDPETEYTLGHVSIKIPKPISIEPDDSVILVDASKVTSLPSGIVPEQVVEIIDHRKMTNASIKIEMVGAAATIVTEKYMKQNVQPSQDIALLLFGAIASNTLDFRANVTTDRDYQAAEWLKSKHVMPSEFVNNMFLAKSNVAGAKLRERLAGDRMVSYNGEKLVSILQLELIEANRIAHERVEEICAILSEFESEKPTDFSFASFLDLTRGTTTFIAHNHQVQAVLQDIFSVSFQHNLAVYDSFIMRKEIGPKLADYFTNAKS